MNTPDPHQALIDRILNKDMPQEAATQMVVRESDTISLNVTQLRAIIAKNPNHAKAKTFSAATRNHRGSDTVAVEKIDLEAIIRDKNVTTIVTEDQSSDEEGNATVVPVERKMLDE